jgi:hypothetical protein
MSAMGVSVASTGGRIDVMGASLAFIRTRMSDKRAFFARMHAPIGGMRVPNALVGSRIRGRPTALALVGAPLPDSTLPVDGPFAPLAQGGGLR